MTVRDFHRNVDPFFERSNVLCILVAFFLTFIGWGLSCDVHAQAYPSRPINIVVPFPPGGFSDVYGRIIANRMAVTFGQSVVVDNKPGAGGNIGTDLVAKSAPDGYHLLMGTIGTHAINAALYAKLPFDPAKDFVAVAFVVDAEGLLVANPKVPVHTVADIVALAKEKPASLNYASAGVGTTSHLAAEIFKSSTRTNIVHVAYKGNTPAIQDVLSGFTQITFATLPTVLPYVRARQLTPIAVLESRRSATLPEVPTVAESGVKGFSVENWTGLFAPAGTSPVIVEKLNAEVSRIMREPEVQARMVKEGVRSATMTDAQFTGFVRDEAAKWGGVIRHLGITAE